MSSKESILKSLFWNQAFSHLSTLPPSLLRCYVLFEWPLSTCLASRSSEVCFWDLLLFFRGPLKSYVDKKSWSKENYLRALPRRDFDGHTFFVVCLLSLRPRWNRWRLPHLERVPELESLGEAASENSSLKWHNYFKSIVTSIHRWDHISRLTIIIWGCIRSTHRSFVKKQLY